MCGVVQGHCPSLGLSPEGAQGPHRSCKICRHGGHSCLSTRVKFQCVPQPEQHRSGDVGLRHRFGHQLGYFQLYITSGTVSLHVWVLFQVPAWQRGTLEICVQRAGRCHFICLHIMVSCFISMWALRMKMAQRGLASTSSKYRQQRPGFGRLYEIMSTVWTLSSESQMLPL